MKYLDDICSRYLGDDGGDFDKYPFSWNGMAHKEDLALMTCDEMATMGRGNDIDGDALPYLEALAFFSRDFGGDIVFHLPTLTELKR